MPVHHIGVQDIFTKRAYLFRLVSDVGNVYMRVDQTNFQNEKRFVVLVKIADFFKEWSHDSQRRIAIHDHDGRRYREAARCFSLGVENPVPLAEVSTWIEEETKKSFWVHRKTVKRLRVGITNGITRTQWLIDNRFDTCPVETDRESAQLLHQHFGVPGTEITTVECLLGLEKV